MCMCCCFYDENCNIFYDPPSILSVIWLNILYLAKDGTQWIGTLCYKITKNFNSFFFHHLESHPWCIENHKPLSNIFFLRKLPMHCVRACVCFLYRSCVCKVRAWMCVCVCLLNINCWQTVTIETNANTMCTKWMKIRWHTKDESNIKMILEYRFNIFSSSVLSICLPQRFLSLSLLLLLLLLIK